MKSMSRWFLRLWITDVKPKIVKTNATPSWITDRLSRSSAFTMEPEYVPSNATPDVHCLQTS